MKGLICCDLSVEYIKDKVGDYAMAEPNQASLQRAGQSIKTVLLQ